MWLSNAAIFLALGQAGWFHTGSMGKQYFEKCFFLVRNSFLIIFGIGLPGGMSSPGNFF